eukprot:8885942-Alexandrium_andersonii.AAC.1
MRCCVHGARRSRPLLRSCSRAFAAALLRLCASVAWSASSPPQLMAPRLRAATGRQAAGGAGSRRRAAPTRF